MTNDNTIKEKARAFARDTLSNSPAFRGLDKQTQFKMYNDLVQQKVQELSANGRSGAMGIPAYLQPQIRNKKGPQDAMDLLNPDVHKNDNLDRAGDRMGDFVDKVDFPAFVTDLLKGVFDANLEVTQKQMTQYGELLKQASKDISHFINQIDDTAAFRYLVDNNSNEFGLSFPSFEEEGKAVILTDKEGNAVDTEDSKIKGMIMNSKIAMAKENRAMLREMLMMGLQRLVVEEGEVEASVLFQINSKSNIARGEQGRMNREMASKQYDFGFNPLFVGASKGVTERKETQISVASLNSTQQDEMSAKLAGKVRIKFKSDYFKLDNFAKMYGGLSDEDIAEAKGGEANAQKGVK